MILKCTCVDVQQDKMHGLNYRVHNKTAKTNPQTYRCVTCGKERTESR
jgi:hypothetical protein